jgi:transcriptional regulator with XRE-family HTH domain
MIGERIKEARTALKLSQEGLGKRLGVTREAVSQWERGDAQPTPGRVVEIALALNCSHYWLVTGKGLRDDPAVPSGGDLDFLLARVRPSIRAEVVATVRRLAEKDPETVLEWMARASMTADERENTTTRALPLRLRELADLVEDAQKITRAG